MRDQVWNRSWRLMLGVGCAVPAMLACAVQPVWAQSGPNDDGPGRETVVVIGRAPLDEGAPLDRVPGAASHLDQSDISRTGSPDMLGALDGKLGGVTLDLAQGNPYQPNLVYRGFEASPLQGNAQGLAVYLDGARFNQAFGDTVDWDLIPDIAVRDIDLVAANPAFGLNALGGALNVRLKTAKDAEGASLELSGGSHGLRKVQAEAAGQVGAFGLYGALSGSDEDGWRDFSPSRLRQGYFDIGWSGETSELHASLLSVRNTLTGNGATPEELLAQDRSAVFTHPDRTHNDFDRLSLGGDWRLGGGWTVRGRAYAAWLNRRTENGDAAEVEPCEDDEDTLCSEEADAILTDRDGAPIPNFVTDSPYADDFPEFEEGGPYAFLNQSRTRTGSWGVGVQANREAELFGMLHRFSVGASVDGARTRFDASTEIGELSLDRGFIGPGIGVDQPDAGINPVGVRVTNTYWGVFGSDAIDLTPDVTLTLTGRHNIADVKLRDQLGDELNGDHRYERFNPAVGLTWRSPAGISVYGGYAESNRAPTPAELSCANPDAPCSLANFFVADPPLKQVVARTWEAGLRGALEHAGVTIDWRLGAYRTSVSDDIQLVASEVAGRGYFTNVGKTRREGVEAGVAMEAGPWNLFADYAWTKAAYRTAFELNAGANPAFDDEDDVMLVEPGDHRPGIPEHSLKAGAEYGWGDHVWAGVEAVWSSGRYLLGDEANLNAKTDSYVVANAYARARVTRNVDAFVRVQNLFDEDYETFGAFSPVDAVPVTSLPDIENPRSLSPGAPRTFMAGIVLRL